MLEMIRKVSFIEICCLNLKLSGLLWPLSTFFFRTPTHRMISAVSIIAQLFSLLGIEKAVDSLELKSLLCDTISGS
jgi:hypothetical protein